MIGSCDWCGEYCQNADHLEWAEEDAECTNYGHMGPWHGADGRPRSDCTSPEMRPARPR